MNQNSLKGRIERLETKQRPPSAPPMVVEMREGESEMDLASRVATAGRPVAIMPGTCATVEEWEYRHAPRGMA